MSEYKSPYTGEQTDALLHASNFNLYKALNASGTNLDVAGNNNTASPTNDPSPGRFLGTFDEFKNEFVKLLNRTYMKDYFITDSITKDVTLNLVEIFRQFSIRKSSAGLSFDQNGVEYLTISDSGITIKKNDTISESDITHVAIFNTAGLIGKLAKSWFASQLELNEVRATAQGATVAYVFDNISILDSWIAGTGGLPSNNPTAIPADLQIGNNLYTLHEEEQDYWWDGNQKQPLGDNIIISNYIQKSNVINNLTSDNIDLPLSANQGKILDEKDGYSTIIFSKTLNNTVTSISGTIKGFTSALIYDDGVGNQWYGVKPNNNGYIDIFFYQNGGVLPSTTNVSILRMSIMKVIATSLNYWNDKDIVVDFVESTNVVNSEALTPKNSIRIPVDSNYFYFYDCAADLPIIYNMTVSIHFQAL